MTNRKSHRKVILIPILVLSVLILAVIALYFNELKTLVSLKKVDNYPFYIMRYAGDYGFDEFLKTGAMNDKEIERFVTRRLLKGLNIDLKISDAGCTAFTAFNPEGQRIYARNFDFDYAPSMILYTEPDNGYKSISMVNLSYAGYGAGNLPTPLGFNSFITLAAPYLPFDGMNECGVTMALLAVPFAEPPQKPDQVTLNTTTAIRLVLDKAKNVDEAISLLKQYNYYFSGDVECHYLISDTSGKSVVVEFLDNDLKITENTGNYQIASNFIIYNGMNAGEGGDEFQRYDIADKALKDSSGALTETQAMQVLSDAKIPDRTQWSVVYNMEKKNVKVCIHGNYDRTYEYEMNDF